MLVFVMHACLCLCSLLQRDQHNDTCLFVFVMRARWCLCRLLQPPCRKEEDIDKGDGRSSRSLHGDKQPRHSQEPPELVDVEAGPRVLTPQRSPYWEGVGSVVLRACGGCNASI